VTVKRNIALGLGVLGISGLVLATACGPALADTDADVLARIRPIAKVSIAQPPPPTPPAAAPAPAPATAAAPATEATAAGASESRGKKIFDTVCTACHSTGAANAPKVGDKAAWAPRIAKGMDALLHSALNGVPGTAMAPHGTCATCTADDLKAVIEYMVSQSK
jgi:cytochrome c5